ncbi:hypothetical protein GCM10022254_33780 [Actinomadura meridiana]|uniref:HTH araC/xylS-type domain-containing protein n=1 Tax=Actinomadura meridiana TaxID=559626 RepID=A0ABP8C371_9ACTN
MTGCATAMLAGVIDLPVTPLTSQLDPAKVRMGKPRVLGLRTLTEGAEQSVADDADDRSVRLSADVLFAVDKADLTPRADGSDPSPQRMGTTGGVTLVDSARQTRYNPLSTQNGPCTCSMMAFQEAKHVLGPGESLVLWDAYKPPSDATNLELQIPWEKGADAVVAPHEYLVSRRIDAARALVKTGLPLPEIAQRTGFADQSHLHRHFTRIVGVTPGRYRRA